jgi:hypothetical protein
MLKDSLQLQARTDSSFERRVHVLNFKSETACDFVVPFLKMWVQQ